MIDKITSEIFQVGGNSYTSPEDAAIYLIFFNGRAALVDAGCGHHQKQLYQNIAQCGVDPTSIDFLLITHCHFDHTGGAAAVRNDTGCQTIAHEREAPFLETGDNQVTAADWYGAKLNPFPVDIKLSGPENHLMLGGKTITAIHTPGHSPGSLVYLTESDGQKILFGQDVHGPLALVLKSNRHDYLESLKKLIDLNADILCEGHFGIYKGKENVKKFIGSFLSS